MSALKILGLFLVGLCGSCSSTTYTHGVPNLVQVDTGVWRSGQPETPEAWAYLKSLGIKRVVKLNFEGSDDGARSIYLPIEPNGDVVTVLEKPNAAHVDAAVAALALRNGVLVHCTRGLDRTGEIVGIYRVRSDHWKKSAARREMLARGYHPELIGLDEYWEDDVP